MSKIQVCLKCGTQYMSLDESGTCGLCRYYEKEGPRIKEDILREALTKKYKINLELPNES